MQRHTLYILILCLGVALGLMWFMQQPAATKKSVESPLAQLQLADIDSIDVADSRGTIANLELSNNAWYETVSGYRANNQRISRLLNTLLSMRVLETKTSRTDLYSRLGVEPISSPGARGVELRLAGSNNNQYTLTFGDQTSNGQYMRPADESTTVLITPAIELPVDRIDWLERELLNIPATELISIKLQHADGELVELVKADPGQRRFTLLNIPQDRELATPDAANSIAGILSELRMESVRRVETIGHGEPDVIGEFKTVSGTIVKSETFSTADSVYFIFTIVNESAQTDGEPANNFQGWAYTLPGFKREQFLTRMTDLLK